MISALIWMFAFTVVALLGIVAAFVVAVASLIATVRRWGSPNRRRHVRRMLLALAAIPLLFGTQQAVQSLVVGQRMAGFDAASAEWASKAAVVHVGEAAPQFSLTTASGDEFSMPADDKVILINFFATWCGPCQAELPHMEKIWQKLQSNEKFGMLVIGREETLETVREYRERTGFSFPIAADPDRQVYSLFAEELIPRTVIVSPDGRIVYSKAGFVEEDLAGLHQILEEQLSGGS